ncbi:MAG: hypothetical protein ABFD77_07345, partial [Thermotogota bacterium]
MELHRHGPADRDAPLARDRGCLVAEVVRDSDEQRVDDAVRDGAQCGVQRGTVLLDSALDVLPSDRGIDVVGLEARRVIGEGEARLVRIRLGLDRANEVAGELADPLVVDDLVRVARLEYPAGLYEVLEGLFHLYNPFLAPPAPALRLARTTSARCLLVGPVEELPHGEEIPFVERPEREVPHELREQVVLRFERRRAATHRRHSGELAGVRRI